ncbi:hypothetical protein D0T49_11905 [Paludibacter sp. 221]|uniref:hypothetical protein n=1 Tax=Paludibacter sp. 221 TaxID=2302939 RepID=UPI0013D1F2DA|nr:hypothetical protein [Paludibacter sp. 221]NDV47751.1 hypothetical protein [Paludibacter sp. 221]
MKHSTILPALVFALLLSSCKNEPQPPYVYETNPEYTNINLTFYGACYYEEYGIPHNVMSMQLTTEGMLNEEGEIIAAGQQLYIEDIFIPASDNTLSFRTYYAADEPEVSNFLPGQLFKVDNYVTYIGSWIYYQEEDAPSKKKYIKEGTFTYDTSGITFDLITDDDKKLSGKLDLTHENGQLPEPVGRKPTHDLKSPSAESQYSEADR